MAIGHGLPGSLQRPDVNFSLKGEKLNGKWHLVRMRRDARSGKDNWLLIKAHDEWERSSKDPDILEEMPLSAVSDRSIEEIAAGKGKRRVWHSNRSVKENAAESTSKAAATRKNSVETKAEESASSGRRSASQAAGSCLRARHPGARAAADCAGA